MKKNNMEKYLKTIERSIKNRANGRLKEAFIAGFLVSSDKFNAQNTYSMDEKWLDPDETDIERKLKSVIAQVSKDLSDDYSKFLKNKSWYNKLLSNTKISELIRSKKIYY